MLSLLLILLVVGAGLAVFLLVGSLYLQGYIYTEPNPGLLWLAPAAGAVVTAVLALWCFSVALSDRASPRDIPYDTIFRFSPRVEMVDRPVKELWAVRKDGQVVRYVRQSEAVLGQTRDKYVAPTNAGRPWQRTGVVAVDLNHDGEKHRFELQPTSAGDYRTFATPDGWVMKEFEDGPTGQPLKFRWGRFLSNVLLNALHLAAWFLGLWVLIRFQWAHALGLACLLWVVVTLTVLPMLLGHAAGVAQERQRASATQAGAAPPAGTEFSVDTRRGG